MIVYSVACVVDKDYLVKWEQYFIQKHLDDVMASGCFEGYQFKKRLIADGRIEFTSDYFCDSVETLDRYNKHFAPALKEDIVSKFGGYFTAERTVYTLIAKK